MNTDNMMTLYPDYVQVNLTLRESNVILLRIYPGYVGQQKK